MNVPRWKIFAAVWLVVVAVNAVVSCTIIPRTVRSREASFDGTNQNSGFVGWTADGKGVLTARARARYNELVRLYGERFLPAIGSDYGIERHQTAPEQWTITPEALVKFQTMTRWHKSRAP